MKAIVKGIKHKSTRVFTESGESVFVTPVKYSLPQCHGIIPLKDKTLVVWSSEAGIKKKNIKSAELGEKDKFSVPYSHKVQKIYENKLVSQEDAQKFQAALDDKLKSSNHIKLSGVSKGKGTAGTVKRWNFKTQDATHGNSLSHRHPGSIGGNQPGRVWLGHKMAGRMGCERITEIQKKIHAVDADKKVILFKGSVPGAVGSEVSFVIEDV